MSINKDIEKVMEKGIEKGVEKGIVKAVEKLIDEGIIQCAVIETVNQIMNIVKCSLESTINTSICPALKQLEEIFIKIVTSECAVNDLNKIKMNLRNIKSEEQLNFILDKLYSENKHISLEMFNKYMDKYINDAKTNSCEDEFHLDED
ncbi:hypothetical protein Ccar_08710 [Clostridium carboxidivorans P7]|uniref:Uncharacterized protein n=1 Tax=Clostridium carboxidivorans P7 TaxID=536227 RepID=C6PMX2_9CLOT|nr:hypothetical protein [Clostridium carboxidivorans]AKN30918.1 hypothetical protein Ccar_08710 [Clostridium carboxidivorans P7]EET89305.1 hypothetical protein CcarbDRAFT_0139 [Clostridium carboxidivorans P7]EFG88830.1 hypothetical protein CLCAR_1577 [Clostridium carboxidivorans P7]